MIEPLRAIKRAFNSKGLGAFYLGKIPEEVKPPYTVAVARPDTPDDSMSDTGYFGGIKLFVFGVDDLAADVADLAENEIVAAFTNKGQADIPFADGYTLIETNVAQIVGPQINEYSNNWFYEVDIDYRFDKE